MTEAAVANADPRIDFVVESDQWDAEPGAQTTITRALRAAHNVVQPAQAAVELAIVLTDDSTIRELNRTWRQRDEPTNVLSFPATPAAAPAAHLGDIVIAFETTAREALAEEKPFANHLTHLAVHGYLHLLGYDHESDREADVMEAMERTILARLDMPDPYSNSVPH